MKTSKCFTMGFNDYDFGRDTASGAARIVEYCILQKYDDQDKPSRDFPQDGEYVKHFRHVESSKFEECYTPGPKDRLWIEECERNYVFRLENQGKLDIEERSLEQENPKLFQEIKLYRTARIDARSLGRIQPLLMEIEGSTMAHLDLSPSSLRIKCIQPIFAEARKKIGPMKEDRWIISDFIPLFPAELHQIFCALVQNRSIKTMNIIEADLIKNIDDLIELCTVRSDFTSIQLTNVDLEGNAILKMLTKTFFIEIGVSLETFLIEGDTALLCAIRCGQAELLASILTRTPNISVRDNQGHTAIHLALRLGHLNLIPMLINAGIDLEQKDQDGSTPIHLAFDLGHFDVIPALVEAGADLEKKDKFGNTALLRAVAAKNKILAEQMLKRSERPANILAINNEKENALHIAAKQGDTEQDQALALFLLDYKVNGLALNEKGKKPQEVAFEAGNHRLAEIIDGKIIDLRIQQKPGFFQPSSLAENSQERVEKLIQSAQAAVLNNKLKEAIKFYSEAIKIDNENVGLYNLRAEAYLSFSSQTKKSLEVPNIRKALADYERSLDLDSTQEEVGEKVAELKQMLIARAGFPDVPQYAPSETGESTTSDGIAEAPAKVYAPSIDSGFWQSVPSEAGAADEHAYKPPRR